VRTYLVGGAVRDRLLGRPVADRDWVVTGVTPAELERRGFRRVGKAFPVFLHPESHEEYALPCRDRGDPASAAGAGIAIEDDLRSRDLTINALAEDEQGCLIDPVGGLRDLQARRLHMVSTETFVRDPLRVLRVARLAAELDAYGFEVTPETRRAMGALRVREGLLVLPGERIWAELRRALATDRPQRFIRELREAGVLAEVLPEVDRLFGVPQPERWHPEIDTGVHTLLVLEQAARLSPREAVRFAALTHDLGKGTTPADILPSHRGHEERGVGLVERLGERIRVPGALLRVARKTARWHAHVHRAADLRPGTVLDVIEGCDALRRPDDFEAVLLACEADYRGRAGFQDRAYPQADFFRRAFEAVSSVDAAAVVAGAASRGAAESLRKARVAAIAGLPRGAGPSLSPRSG
jgi:tRNA nucleotidyltransferase (CCA-adding enzyme)